MRPSFHRMSLPVVLGFFLVAAIAPAAAAAPSAPQPASRPEPRPWLSSAGELMFREELARGNYRDHPLARWYSTSTWTGARPLSPDDRMVASGGPAVGATQFGLATDARANDRIPAVGCIAPCIGLAPTQCEPTVAVHGPYIVAGWNDYEQVQCPGAGQTRSGYGYSSNGGLTFTDGGGFPQGDVPGTRIGGDPVHAVNHKTAEFYIGGLSGGGLGGVSGHFSGSSFVLDRNTRVVASIPSVEFYDKPWMNVDSLSGNVYFAWANFASYGVSRIEFQRFDPSLNALGPKLSLSDTSGASCGSQFAQIAVGPGGVVWVSWVQLHCVTGQLLFFIRKSVDFGVSFAPAQLITNYTPNGFNGAPGMLRSSGPYPQSLAVDATNGPYRGRLYAAWDEPVKYPNGPQSDTTSIVESEPNNTSLTANAFVPGGKIRGTMLTGETDWLKFDLRQGETIFLAQGFDSMDTGFQARLWCEDAGSLRLVANGQTWGILFTAPSDRTYYYEMKSQQPDDVPYVMFSAILVADASSRGRDHRDQFLSWSDDGTNWSEPTLLTDSPPGFDGVYPSVAVDGRGIVHVFWIDFREDPVCGAKSSEYVVSSGDGGVTWGPNRRLGDGPATAWPLNYCIPQSGNTMGDYLHMNADGDRVVAATNEPRLGDPDIFVDASYHHAVTLCAGPVDGVEGRDTVVSVPLVNAGNYARELSWRMEESAGWATGITPGASGLTTLATGETLKVEATLGLGACLGDSTLVRFIYSDPAMPGHEDTCVTVVRCTDGTTSVLASLISAEAGPDAVTLVWYVPEIAGTPARVWRRGATGPEAAIGAPELTGSGRWRFTDRAVVPGEHYAYRLETPTGEGPSFSAETWVEVPLRVEFALRGLSPNPASDPPVVLLSLPSRAPARLEAFDLSGRRVFSRALESLGPGHHAVKLDRGVLSPGLYTLRLTQDGRVASVKAAVVR